MPTSGGRALIASIVPKIDPADLADFINTISSALGSAIGVSVSASAGAGVSPVVSTTTTATGGTSGATGASSSGVPVTTPAVPVGTPPGGTVSSPTGDRSVVYANAQNGSVINEENAKDMQKRADEQAKANEALQKQQMDQQKQQADAVSRDIKAFQKAIGMGVDLATGWVKMSFETVSDIYNKIKESSPLLQTVERLFNLAMTLFFMPVGNAIAETILPYTIDLVEKVIDVWDMLDSAYNSGGLGAMVTKAISEGTKVFGNYFISIGTTLSKEGGVVGSIGDTLVILGEFVRDNLATVIKTMLSTVVLVLSHLKEFISLYVGIQATMASLMTILILTTATAGATTSFGSSLGVALAGLGIAGGVGGIAYQGTYSALTVAGLADGGYVPSTPGGQLRIMAEAGEGEYAVPESKAVGFAQDVMAKNGSAVGNTYNITINGITFEELKNYLNDLISEQISSSRYRSGF